MQDLLKTLFSEAFAGQGYVSKALTQKMLKTYGIEFFDQSHPQYPSSMEIRPATPADVEAMSRLAQALVIQYISPDLSPEAAVILYRSMGADGIAQAMATTVRYHVATIAADIVGLIGIQNHRHLYHLFVAATHHRQGIARALWQTALAQSQVAGNSGEFTVNSSRYAQPMYEKLGFVQSGTAPSHGVVSIPMTFKLAAN